MFLTCASSPLAFFSLVIVLWFVETHTQVVSPLVTSPCVPWGSSAVVCVNGYSAVMPDPFYRNVSESGNDTYASTSVPSDPSFVDIANASFVVFDRQRGLEILGLDPVLEFMFKIDSIGHEGPVYVPDLNKLYITQMQSGRLSQLVIDLDQSPPTLSFQTADPPLYDPTGGFFYQGLIYYSTLGNDVIDGQVFRPGIYTLNATTGKSTLLLNNYFGYYFNGCDDLVVDSRGDVWFTDNCKCGGSS